MSEYPPDMKNKIIHLLYSFDNPIRYGDVWDSAEAQYKAQMRLSLEEYKYNPSFNRKVELVFHSIIGPLLNELSNKDDKLVELKQKLEMAEEKIKKAKNCLVCCSIGDAYEICTTTYDILDQKNDEGNVQK
jgi:hypothetical protein